MRTLCHGSHHGGKNLDVTRQGGEQSKGRHQQALYSRSKEGTAQHASAMEESQQNVLSGKVNSQRLYIARLYEVKQCVCAHTHTRMIQLIIKENKTTMNTGLRMRNT